MTRAGALVFREATPLVDALHVCALSTFAIAAPIMEKLQQNAEFFAARRSDPGTIIALALILTLAPPAVLMMIERLLGTRAHVPIVGVLLTLICLQAFHESALPGLLSIAMCAAAGGALAQGCGSYPSVRIFLSALSPAVLLVPAWFLMGSPVSSFIVGGPTRDLYPEVRSRTPVVVAIFDELPLVSLLDARGRIDARRYPNFAALAKQSTWYREASTVADKTVNAVPALLSGCYPHKDKLPIAGDYPRTLFSLLGGRYDVQAYESITGLCPKNLLGEEPLTSLDPSLKALLSDVAVVYLHLVVPRDVGLGLPDITATWKNYGAFCGDSPAHNRIKHYMACADDYRAFLKTLHRGTRPPLIFSHAVIPHLPWRFMPSGRAYATDDAPEVYARGVNETWSSDPFAVADAWQRHLLHVGFADRLLGELIVRLKAIGIYDECILVVTSDHGCSFTPGTPRRRLVRENHAEILPIPLLVKMPHQKVAALDSRNVQSIDVVPSLADALGIRLSWPMDGKSFLKNNERPAVKTCYSQNETRMTFAAGLPEQQTVLERKVALFGADDGLHNYGPQRQFFGVSVNSIPRVGNSGLEWEQAEPDRYLDAQPGGGFIPAWIRGRIHGRQGRIQIAVAVNGVVRTTTYTFIDGDSLRFEAVIPEQSFRAGVNSVQAYQIVGTDGKLALAPIRGR